MEVGGAARVRVLFQNVFPDGAEELEFILCVRIRISSHSFQGAGPAIGSFLFGPVPKVWAQQVHFNCIPVAKKK